MKVTGSAVLHAPVDEVWTALNDPAVLSRTIPGCKGLEETEPSAYRMTVTAGVATIKGTYQGEVRLTDRRPPNSFVLRASGGGGPGTVSADVLVSLTEEAGGHTLLEYDADAVVGGMIGGVGQRVLSTVAKRTAREFFTAVDDVLTGRAPALTAPAVAAGTAAETGTAGADRGADPTDLTAPADLMAPAAPARPLPAAWERPATPAAPVAAGSAGSAAGFARGAVFGAVLALACTAAALVIITLLGDRS
ncbi:carbon monoxide dehydrogenase subunit G [Streptosporangium sp. NPDC051022]|uniref:SRPBCC family protein n=1 Tax=Streptosporangium sp. NPDC051022 TaxID=3155752 RepID=UPI0034487C29